MSQANQKINSHIETYLDYYCGLSHAPGFAVLLQGQWGSGKTWFINEYREKLKEENRKCLYVSLYGMTSFSDIEDAFFQQLHPILSSKGMAITGKLLKGFIKGTLKFDWDSDKSDDGALNVQVPEINLPEYLRNTDKAILIFDDLERCKIDLSNILGYINYFVEHQDLKVILIANEDELLKDCNYQIIKEKLIGKTFAVSLDFEGALENFIAMLKHSDVIRFLSENTELIRDFYEKAEYENLRNLKQIVLDFERIFDVLPEKAKNQSELLKDLLKPLMAFSIEIKRGVLLPKNIGQLQEEYRSGTSRRVSSCQEYNTIKEEVSEEITPLEKMLERYVFLNLLDPFPSKAWWQIFFDKGTIDVKELHQSIENSKYFQDENTPNWIRLWHFTDLSDNEFGDIINEVEANYASRDYVEIGVIKHVFGLFLMLSNANLYAKRKEEILSDSKLYIEHLKNSGQLDLTSSYSSFVENSFVSYCGLGFQGKDFREFIEFTQYINKARELAKEDNMPAVAQALLDIMQIDTWKFYRMICRSEQRHEDALIQSYWDVPVLIYIDLKTFIDTLLTMDYEFQSGVFWALSKRYEFDQLNAGLIKELAWLQSTKNLLQIEINNRRGKLSGFKLESLITHYLNGVIKKLEIKQAEMQNSQE
jgi:hypothetical protein